jgi:hypothetical protein
MRKGLIVAAIVGAALTGCTPIDHDYHGAVAGNSASSEAPATHINAAPVTVTGTGESVKTVELESGGYTVNYTAASNYLIVAPVQSSGEDGPAIVNANGSNGVTGTTTFHANGRTTFHVSNTQGEWSLTFTPL